jgi:diguanylate cyclase (GGDEF)-like protein
MHTTDTDLESRLASAIALYRSNDLVPAFALYEALLRDLDGQVGDPALAVRTTYWAARCARRLEKPDDAIRLIYVGLAAARDASSGGLECLLRAELVYVLSALGQNDDAFEQADAALQRSARLADPVGAAAAQVALASIYWMTKDWTLGLKAYEVALQLAQACGDLELQVLSTLGLAATQAGVAEIERTAGQTDAADARVRVSIALQRKSGTLAAQLGDSHLAMYSELNCGCSLHSLGALAEARTAFEACLANPKHEAIHGNALTQLGQIALDEGDPVTALKLLGQALGIVEARDKLFPVMMVLELLVDAHEALGDSAAALACMRRFHALYVKNASERVRVRAQALSVKYETERALALAEMQRERADRLERSNVDLADQSERHARASMEDALTGIANRRRFDAALRAHASDGATISPCSVALIDIDHFKRVNDDFSHLVGDEVLRRLGSLLSSGCRRDDLAARYGGEEFALLTSTAQRLEMRQLCERLRQSVESLNWAELRPGLAVTVSIGIAHHDEVSGQGAVALEAFVALADARLYAAKNGGRNRVCDEDVPLA